MERFITLDGINEKPTLTSNNRWRLRRAALRSSSEESDALQYIEIPTHVDSYDALIFAGFKKKIAAKIIARYNELRSDSDLAEGVDLVDLVQTSISTLSYDCSELDDNETWDATLRNLGVRKQLRLRILAPGFEDIRSLRSGKEWAEDFIAMSLDFVRGADTLVQLKQKMEQRNEEVRQGTSRAERTSESLPDSAPTLLTTFTEKAKLKPNETTFYRGCAAVNVVEALGKDDRIFMPAILSRTPGDFDGWSPALYMTKERKTARKYAEYTRNAINPGEVAILSINIPHDLLEGYDVEDRMEFKRAVWDNRREVVRTEFTRKLHKHGLIYGAVCGASNYVLKKVFTSADQIRPQVIDGRQSTQHVFRDPLYEEVARRCVNKTYVELIPAPQK